MRLLTGDDDQVDDGDFTELTDMTIDRVDLVGAGANGQRVLIAKSTREDDMQFTVFPRVSVRKAKVEAKVAVYDAHGALLGLIDESDLVEVKSPSKVGERESVAPPMPAGPQKALDLTPRDKNAVGTPAAGNSPDTVIPEPTPDPAVQKTALGLIAKGQATDWESALVKARCVERVRAFKATNPTPGGLKVFAAHEAGIAAQQIRALRARR